jgi:hypothetical protein
MTTQTHAEGEMRRDDHRCQVKCVVGKRETIEEQRDLVNFLEKIRAMLRHALLGTIHLLEMMPVTRVVMCLARARHAQQS